MTTVCFTITERPQGYYARGSRPNGKRLKQYMQWRDTVRGYAMLALLRLPLRASKNVPLVIVTRSYFENGVHPDPENVHKGVVDALFYAKPKGSADKYTGGQFSPPLYDPERPRVEVWVMDALSFESKGPPR